MTASFLPEPELEFGGSGRHIDIRHGLMNFGPLDLGASRAAPRIRVGLVGSAATTEGIAEWISRCRQEVAPKPGNKGNLFARFPGFSVQGPFGTQLEFDNSLVRLVAARSLAECQARPRAEAVASAAELFAAECEHLVEGHQPDVIVVAPPRELLDVMDGDPALPFDEAPYFHDVLKALALRIGVPLQMVRPETYDEHQRRPQRGRSWLKEGLQDEATRAWNFHTAMYYKAGGLPWRMAREATAFTACYVGISFYQSATSDRLDTSIAEVFNERGEGVVLRGGPARIDKDDRTPHLAGSDAQALLSSALSTYRREHGTNPARIVIHKSSRNLPEELAGFAAAADHYGIGAKDILSVGGTGFRAFRDGSYPPLRGSRFELDETSQVLYTKGSVDFFALYPGMYVPAPILIRSDDVEQTSRFLAAEVLALTKMNWNNTQFDGAFPITLRAAKQVGDILRHVDPGDRPQTRYAFYM